MANQLKAEQQSVQQDVSALRDRLAQDEKANADLQGDLKVVTDKLKLTQGQLKKAREESSKLNDETSAEVDRSWIPPSKANWLPKLQPTM